MDRETEQETRDSYEKRAAKLLEEYGQVEQHPRMEGRTMVMYMSPRRDRKQAVKEKSAT